ncbi:unnamed protein product [Allacma fusca]|uniref:Uncharacterized protein n=1 Tax=Allacma fusca TaxID=39272 RepID=A0A8J2JQW6_9HEXA|nr:unnamed protein product [Allacma fusca]
MYLLQRILIVEGPTLGDKILDMLTGHCEKSERLDWNLARARLALWSDFKPQGLQDLSLSGSYWKRFYYLELHLTQPKMPKNGRNSREVIIIVKPVSYAQVRAMREDNPGTELTLKVLLASQLQVVCI